MTEANPFFRTIGKVLVFTLIGMIVLLVTASASGVLDTAEWYSTVFNLLGLIFVGLITLMGVAAAHEMEERARQRNEDRTRVFEPVRREMETILHKEHEIDEGGWVWSAAHASEDFQQVMARGLLQVPHRGRLRADIEEIRRLEREFGERWSAFHNAGGKAIGTALGKAKALLRDAETWISGEEIVTAHRNDAELLRALAAPDGKDRWVQGLRSPRWVEIRPDPAELYAEAHAAVGDVRESYRSSARAVLDQARKIRDGIDRATESGKHY